MSEPRRIFLMVMAEELLAIGPNNETARYRRVRGAASKRGASVQIVCTPDSLLEWVHIHCLNRDGGGWNWDLAANADNGVAGRASYFGPGSLHSEDALQASWADTPKPRWCNPPFSMLAKFTDKARYEHLCGVSSVLLVRDSPGAKWWRDNVVGYAQIYHIGRVWFVGREWQTPFDLAVLVYDGLGTVPPPDCYPALSPAQRGQPPKPPKPPKGKWALGALPP